MKAKTSPNLIVCLTLAAATSLVAGVLATRAQAPDDSWFELYDSKRGAPLTEMRRSIRVGPFEPLALCYAVGSMLLEGLLTGHPDKDFRGRCGDGDLLTLHEMADRASKMLPGPKGDLR